MLRWLYYKIIIFIIIIPLNFKKIKKSFLAKDFFKKSFFLSIFILFFFRNKTNFNSLSAHRTGKLYQKPIHNAFIMKIMPSNLNLFFTVKLSWKKNFYLRFLIKYYFALQFNLMIVSFSTNFSLQILQISSSS